MELMVVWVACAFLAAIAASGKGRSGFLWFVAGCLFGVFALIAVLVLPSVKHTEVVYVEATPKPDPKPEPVSKPLNLGPGERLCPRCGAVNGPQRASCHRCAEILPPPPPTMRPCPHCFMEIDARATVCGHCRRDVEPATQPSPPPQ